MFRANWLTALTLLLITQAHWLGHAQGPPLAPTATAVISAPNPSSYGQSVTFTATVSAGVGTPAGTVQFFDGSEPLGTAGLTGGRAQLTTSFLPQGSHPITAAYSGDGTYAASTSPPMVHVVGAGTLGPTSTSMVSAPNPATLGTPVTFTATVFSLIPGIPSGMITFLDGATTLGSANLANRVATFTISTLTAGSHAISAVYGGDEQYAGSRSPVLTQVITAPPKIATSTTVTSWPNPSDEGQAVTFTSYVSGGGRLPTGTVSFYDAGNWIASSPLVNGQASATVEGLTVGGHSIAARYWGDDNFAASISPALQQLVNPPTPDTTQTMLMSSANPSVTNQSVTFTASVYGGSSTPAGTVQFFNYGELLGTVNLQAGRAQWSTSGLAEGSHWITATYSGDSRHEGSASAPLEQVVEPPKAPTSTTLVTSTGQTIVGQNVTFVATVSSSSGTPTGGVRFLDNGSLLGTISLAGGRAQLTTSALTAGNHSITAVYGGDSTRASSTSEPLVVVVNAHPGAPTSTTLDSSAGQSAVGQAVILTATVSSDSGTPAGSVQFFDGGALLGTVNLNTGRGQFTTSSLAAGTHLLRATYTGNSDFASSSSPSVTHTVLPGDSRPVLSSSANPSMWGQAVTFQTQMDPACGGTVTFLDGSAMVGTALAEQGGRYRMTLSGLVVGVHRIVAVYAGGAVCPTSISEVLEQVVQPAWTSTVISVAKAPGGASDGFVLTATTQVLPPGGGIPAGEVTFYNGDAILGRVTLSPAGVATLAVSLDPAIPHGVAARYPGSSELAASSSVRLTDLSDLSKPDFEAVYVVNSASLAPGLSPGAFATIFGSRLSGGVTAVSGLPYPTAVQGVQVTLDGTALRLAYVSDRQINFLVPSDVAEGTVILVVSTPRGSSRPIEVPLVAASPGIFADPLSGYGTILIAGTAETTLTRPVRAGEYIEIYGTGLGAVDASSRTLLPVTVNIGAMQLPAAYSGANPVYPGLYQVNVQIPQGITGQQTLSIETNGRRSNEVKFRAQ